MKFKLNYFLIRKYNQVRVVLLNKFSKDDLRATKVKYFCENKRALNLENPKEFMEKIQWLKLYHYKEEYSEYVDKFDVRFYVATKIGDEYLNEVIGLYDSVDEIDFHNLPGQYVIKATHGSGYNLIIKNASLVKYTSIKRKLKTFLKSNYYKKYRESIYKNIKPRILIEKYISDCEEGNLIDYKFYCFHGQPKYVLVKIIEKGKEKKCFYDLNWVKIIPDKKHRNWLETEVAKPANFEKMLDLATILSKDFIFIRVDLYSVIDKIIFGEMTFFPTGGYKRFEMDYLNIEMGNLISLPS